MFSVAFIFLLFSTHPCFGATTIKSTPHTSSSSSSKTVTLSSTTLSLDQLHSYEARHIRSLCIAHIVQVALNSSALPTTTIPIINKLLQDMYAQAHPTLATLSPLKTVLITDLSNQTPEQIIELATEKRISISSAVYSVECIKLINSLLTAITIQEGLRLRVRKPDVATITTPSHASQAIRELRRINSEDDDKKAEAAMKIFREEETKEIEDDGYVPVDASDFIEHK